MLCHWNTIYRLFSFETHHGCITLILLTFLFLLWDVLDMRNMYFYFYVLDRLIRYVCWYRLFRCLATTLAIIFHKRSTRTRVASETAMACLGGRSLFLSAQDIQMGVNESMRDTATVLSSMCQAIMFRCNSHDEVEVCRQSWISNLLTELTYIVLIAID
jgi:hypothetical protein